MPRKSNKPARLAVAAACAVLGHAAQAAEQADGRTMALVPSVSVTQTLTDNHLLSPDGRSDTVTQVTAGVGLRSRSSAVQGLLDYSLTGAIHARHSGRNQTQNALNATVAAELVENFLQFNASARVTQGAVSAFGVQPGGGGGISADTNSTEVRTLQVSPVLRGPLGPWLQYTASVSHAITDASGQASGDSTNTAITLQITPRTASRLSWSIDASQQASDFKQGQGTQSSRLNGGLRYGMDDLDLELRATGGIEESDLTTQQRQTDNTWSIGAAWAPSPRTRVSADLDRRAFGSTHSLSVEHRMARLSLLYRNTRSLSTTGSLAQGGQDVIYQLVALEFASITDPVLRDAAVRRRLLDLNLDPTRAPTIGFLASAATLRDSQEISIVWTGRRSSVSASFSRSKTRRADSEVVVADDLSQAGTVVLSNLAVSWSHRLSPESSLATTFTAVRGDGDTLAQSNRQTRAEVSFNTSLTPESVATVSLRRGLYRTALKPYDETAVAASYGIRF